jgi:hypothetical protein
MAVSHVESLVLRGVSVVRDGRTIGLRLDSYEAKPQSFQATPFSMRHPSPGCRTPMPETGGRPFPTSNTLGNGARPVWAGRPGRRAGVLGRRSPAPSAGGTNVHRWFPAVGGPKFTAAVRLCPFGAKQAASVADVFSRRPSTLHDLAFQRLERDERGQQEPPAGINGTAARTLTAASTRGRGF